MRHEIQKQQIQDLFIELAKRCKGPGRIYVTGGSTAVLSGWRESTVDVDMKIDPEPKGVFEAIQRLKNELQVNIELASPDDFLPALPNWEQRSQFITQVNEVAFYHYDYYAQTLSKILRTHERDMKDAEAMVANGLVDKTQLYELFCQIEDKLIRYPSIQPNDFRRKVEKFVGRISST